MANHENLETASFQKLATDVLDKPLKGVNVCVVGGGFVGLVAAAGFAQFGHSVVCVENDKKKLMLLQKGNVPFYERDLDALIKKNIKSGMLSFSGDLKTAVENQKAIFVTVGTPSMGDGRADMTALESVATILKRVLNPKQIVVLKSTVPVGSGDRIKKILSEGKKEGSPSVVNNPEFLREGCAVNDFFHPQRIVLGGDNSEAVETIAHIYRLGMTKSVPILKTNARTAEMIKYASNAFLTTKVGFINELAGLCDFAGINVLDVANGMGLDPRIGSEFLDPGPGWGGSCFRKDLMELHGLAKSFDYSLDITEAVLKANHKQHELVVSKILNLLGDLKGTKIGVLGLAFKAGTSDMRDAAAIPVIKKLISKGAEIVAYDPKAMDEVKLVLPEIALKASPEEVAKDADCLVILTEWQEFQLLDLKKISKLMRRPNLVDTRNLLTPELAERYGMTYTGMGQI